MNNVNIIFCCFFVLFFSVGFCVHYFYPCFKMNDQNPLLRLEILMLFACYVDVIGLSSYMFSAKSSWVTMYFIISVNIVHGFFVVIKSIMLA